MMRTGISITLLGSALLAGLLSFGGCKQNEFERCQIDDDCNTGLYCLLSSTRAAGGYCQSTTSAPLPPPAAPDMTTTADMTTTPPDMVTTTD